MGVVNTCAIADDGRLLCWGGNFQGQLGQGHKNFIGDSPAEMGGGLRPVNLGAGRSAMQVAIGSRHMCALLDDSSVKCWGFNESGQLGLGRADDIGDARDEMGANLPVVSLGAGRKALQVAAGDDHSCALLDDGSVKCWGENRRGQLGQGHNDSIGDSPNEMGDAIPAIDLGTGLKATQISAGGDHSCALLDDGSVKCWGVDIVSGDFGRRTSLGNGPDEMGDNLPVVSLEEGRSVSQISSGDLYACGLLDDGTISCWGNPDVISELTRLDDGSSFVQVSAGRKFACGLLNGGGVACWGENKQGQLGLGHTDTVPEATVGDLVGLGSAANAVEIAAGGDHTCALLDDGTLKCWGFNGRGQLGLGHRDNIGDGPDEMGDSLPAVDLGTK